MPRAVRFSHYGGPEVLEIVDVPELHPGPGEVRIAVRAAGVNPYDWKVRRGLMAGGAAAPDGPQGLGSDLAGVVDQVGADVTAFAVGDEVLGSGSSPSYAEQALAKPADLVARPADLPWPIAGGISGTGRTAYRTLTQLGVAGGETLLVHGAAGGVGFVAVQLAVARGVRVVGAASERHHERLRSVGVVPVAYGDGLEDRVRTAAPDGVDAVLDATGHGVLGLSVRLAGGPDRVITIADGAAAEHGVRFSSGDEGVDMSGALAGIVALIATGELEVPIARTHPLDAVADAHRESESGHAGGKLVLLP
ncbi:MAG: NADP-dependent oxidoreductase [Patulibacter sp.]|nr:NADP-dependent oxidoreductase [Patulibacter sp.]